MDRTATMAQAWDERSRGVVLEAAFRRAWARRHRDDRGSIVRAMTALGHGCASGAARGTIFAEAQKAAAAQPRRSSRLAVLADLADAHPPALPMALEAGREALNDRARSDGALDVLAGLVGDDLGRFDELVAWIEREGAAHQWPARLGRASRIVGTLDPDRVLRAAASVHEYYRALAHALVAASLEGAARDAAIGAALRDENDPSLSDARPYVALAPLLDEASCVRAVELASRLYPSPSAGATAVSRLLPTLASFGHVEDALSRARAIPLVEERGTALARIAPYVEDGKAQEALILEALALLAEGTSVGIALVAPALVPLGYGPFLLELPRARESNALFAMMQVATGAERTEVATELARSAEPAWLVPVARDLPVEIVAPRVDHAIAESEARPEGELLEDETGYGLVPWLPLVAVVGGDEAALAFTRMLAAS